MRKWGWLIFLILPAIFLLDDWATEWHHHGHDTLNRIVIENLVEDFVLVLIAVIGQAWYAAVTASIHVECPNCHFQWMMHPRRTIANCPRCSIPEPD